MYRHAIGFDVIIAAILQFQAVGSNTSTLSFTVLL